MINPSTTPQIDIDTPDQGAGLGPVWRSEPGAAVGKQEGIPGTHQRTSSRQRFDKDGRPLISKGVLLRKDLDKKYKLKAVLMGTDKYILMNDALEYYYENVLKKTPSQKLLEAGQEVLGI